MKRLLQLFLLLTFALPALAQPGADVVDASGRLQRALDRIAYDVTGTTPVINMRRPMTRLTLTGNTTLTIQNYNPGANTMRTSILIVEGNGTHTLTWPSSNPVCNGINGTITPGNTVTLYLLEWTGTKFVVTARGTGGGGGGGVPDDGSVTDIKVSGSAAITPTKIGNGNVDATELSYLNGVTSAVQTQMDARLLKAGDTMTGPLAINGGTITANAPLLDLSQGWNNSGVTFQGVKLNFTDTASAASSLMLDLQVGGVSKVSFRKDGVGAFGTAQIGPGFISFASDAYIGRSGGADYYFTALNGILRAPGFMEMAIDSNNSETTAYFRGFKNNSGFSTGETLWQFFESGEYRFQNGTGAALLKVISTFTDASNGSWLGLDAQGASGRLRIGSEYNGTGTPLPLDFRSGYATSATLATNGVFSFNAVYHTNSVDSASESLSGTTPSADWATKGIKIITLSGNTTFSFANTPSGNGFVRYLEIKVLGNGSHTIAFPGTVDWETPQIGTPPASNWTRYLFEYRDGTVFGMASDGGALDADLTAIGNLTGNGIAARTADNTWALITDSAGLAARLSDESGTGPAVFANNATLTTPTISGAISFPDGTRQTFNPNGTAAGLNVGAHTADPSSPTDGDLWYNSTANALKARINGANVSLSGGGGSSPTTTRGDMIRRGASADERLPLGGLGLPVISDGTDSVFLSPANHVVIREEFIGANGAGDHAWNASGNVLSGQASAFEFAGRPGLASVYGTSANHGAIHLGLTSVLLGGGAVTLEWWVYLPDISNATDEYTARFGLGDALNADHTDGVYFEYDRTASTNWRIVTAANGTRTKTNTATAVAEDTWVKLRIVVNAGATSVAYFINGTEVSGSPLTSNIPSSTGQYCGPNMQIIKTAGSNTRYAVADWFSLFMAITSAR